MAVRKTRLTLKEFVGLLKERKLTSHFLRYCTNKMRTSTCDKPRVLVYETAEHTYMVETPARDLAGAILDMGPAPTRP